MKNLIIILCFFITLSSCQETPATKFEYDGVSLISPKGWAITDQENLDDEGYYLSIEKDGMDASGLLSISWINYEFDLNEWMSIYKDELTNNIIYEYADLTFGEQKEDVFNDINTISISFTANILGLKHDGVIHFFYEKDKTFAILRQEAHEDKTSNKDGFELIEQSFKTN